MLLVFRELNSSGLIPVYTIKMYMIYASDSSVGMALGYGLDNRGSRVEFLAGLGIFLFTTTSRTSLEPTQPPIQWVPEGSITGGKAAGA
jgi:hypothetical protein